MSAPESTSQAVLADRMTGNFAALEISGEALPLLTTLLILVPTLKRTTKDCPTRLAFCLSLLKAALPHSLRRF